MVELVVRQAVSHLYCFHIKVCQRALLARKRLSRLYTPSSVYCGTGGTADIFIITCCVTHLPRACGEEAFGSLHTLPRSAILTRFAPRLTGVIRTAK